MWIVKAAIQILVAAMPRWFGEPFYYQLQRRLGALRNLDPFERFRAGATIAQQIENSGLSLRGRQLLEIGTGWRINTPLGLWLAGGDVVTVDIRRLLRVELVLEDIQRLVEEKSRVEEILAPLSIVPERWEKLKQVAASGRLSATLAELPGLAYLSPQDASQLVQFADETFLGSFSYTVLEHIPPDILRRIFTEVARVCHRGGVSIHMVDHSDHFAQADAALTSVSFLRYQPRIWRLLAGNRLAYCNRLRSSEVANIFEECGYRVDGADRNVDLDVADGIAQGRIPLWDHYAQMAPDDVATRHTWFTLRRDGNYLTS